jgi:hypothetical protein
VIKLIPKIIWQTHEYETQDQLPPPLLANSMTWKNLNPRWEYRYIPAKNRESEIKEFDHTLHNLYVSFSNPVDKSDIWKYVVIAKYGGMWADLDSVCTMPIDYLLKNYWTGQQVLTTGIGFQTEGDFINTSNFAAIKGSSIMQSLCDLVKFYYEKNEDTLPWNFHLLSFSNIMLDNEKDICPRLDLAILHGDGFKDEVFKDLDINYYGKIKTYRSLAFKNGWKI